MNNKSEDNKGNEFLTMSGLYMDSQAPYKDSEALPDTTKSFASSLHKIFKKLLKDNKI
jgi:hypothetical protein